jgi:hypothetical protein
LIIRKKGDLQDTFCEIKYMKKKMDTKGTISDEEMPFIKCWLDDGNKRVYDTYDYLPPPLVSSKEILNTWGGFQIEHEGITTTDDFEYILLPY